MICNLGNPLFCCCQGRVFAPNEPEESMASTEQPLIDLQTNGLDALPAPAKDAVAAAEADSLGGSVLTVITKRMRAAKKKLTRIEGIEKTRVGMEE